MQTDAVAAALAQAHRSEWAVVIALIGVGAILTVAAIFNPLSLF